MQSLLNCLIRVLSWRIPVAKEEIEEVEEEEVVEEGAPATPKTIIPAAEEIIEEPGEEVVEEETVEETVDVSPIVEALGIEEAQAQKLYEAAQQLASLEALEVQEVADALAADFQLRMQVEKIAGGLEDAITADQAEVGIEADIAAGLNPVGMPAPMTPGGY
jgi:plasmid maintenance system antidote protein VapI